MFIYHFQIRAVCLPYVINKSFSILRQQIVEHRGVLSLTLFTFHAIDIPKHISFFGGGGLPYTMNLLLPPE